MNSSFSIGFRLFYRTQGGLLRTGLAGSDSAASSSATYNIGKGESLPWDYRYSCRRGAANESSAEPVHPRLGANELRAGRGGEPRKGRRPRPAGGGGRGPDRLLAGIVPLPLLLPAPGPQPV